MRYTEKTVQELPELDPIEVTLHRLEVMPEGKFGPVMSIDWLLPESYGEEQTVHDFVGLPGLDMNPQTGKPGKNRVLLNAITGSRENRRIKWFDDGVKTERGPDGKLHPVYDRDGKPVILGPPCWGYPEDDGKPNPSGALTEGLPVIIRGKMVTEKDGSGEKWRIQHYQPAARTARPAPSPAPPVSAPPEPAPVRQQAAPPSEDQARQENQAAVDPEAGWDPDEVPF